MFKEKKSFAIFSMVLLSSTMASAATTPDHNDAITLANTKPGYSFSFTALALKPSASNLNYVIFNKELPAQSPNWRENEIMPSYSFAFALAASRIFEDGRDLNIEWTHLNSNTSDSTTAPNANFFLGPDYEIGPDAIPIRNATGNAVFKYDVVNLDVGQRVQFGPHVQMHFFGGLSNGYLREEVTATYSGDLTTGLYQGPFSTRQQVRSSVMGLGPRLGIDGNYTMDNGFGFLGEAAVSALVGTFYTKTNYLSSAPELLALFGQTSNTQTIADQTTVQVVPGLDAKIGIDYRHASQNNATFIVSAGYQAAVYINAISQYLPGSLVTPLSTGGIFVATMNHTLSNYSVRGPFLKATIDFA